MNKYIQIGIGLTIAFIVATTVFIVSLYFSGNESAPLPIKEEPTRPISITISESDLIVVRYQPDTYAEENYKVYVFHTTQEGSKYTCFITETLTINAGSGISCTRDIQTVI